ncbi:hypothetical protein [Candidatus Berkiella aquae]|uniref:Uncharacterized protein n=1 Tax=Candidatus Berkiella aquae TaxID=295108 RepID=A0A0Q9YM78_9GAMM|nr:hypothetical protein [Candidatus Berkiella aquae]MCS5710470.1 hypothetical protein [Candidatus Berkiella aquae]
MPVSAEKDELNRSVEFADKGVKNGAESWQIEDFLKQNQDKMNLSNVITIPKKEVKASYGGEKEVIQFDLLILKDGTTIQANVTTTKEPDGSNSSGFSVDMSKITDPDEAKEVLSKLLDVTLETKLRFHPAGQELRLYATGNPKWDAITREVEQEKCAEFAAKFQEKGIKLYINNKLMIGEPDNDMKNSSQEEPRRAKPWDVPRGAPDARPKRE